MLDQIRQRQRWLTAFFIFAIGIVFVFFLGLGGSAPGPGSSSTAGEAVVVALDDAQIQLSDFLRIRAQQEDRIKASLGEQYDASSLSAFLDSQALNSIVNKVVLSQSALELGLVASLQEVKDLLRHDPNLRDADGRFDQENFDANVKWNYGSQAAFLESMQRDLLQQKLYELLAGQTHIGDAEALSAAKYKTQEVRIAFVAIDAKMLPEAQQPGDEAAKRYLESNREALQAEYDASSSRFSTPEQVMMRHILFTPTPVEDLGGADALSEIDSGAAAPPSNRMRAELTLARLDKGESFADLAGELSDDQVSKADGGKLGLISRGDVTANLEEVAFALEPGTPSEIVEGQDGLHIIQIDEKVPASVLDFAEAGLTLAAEGAAKEVASRLATELSEAVAGGQSLEDAARGAGFTLERTSFFTRRRDGFVPGLRLPSLEIVATAFTLTSEAPSSKQVFEVGNQHVLIQLLDRQEPEPEALEAMVESAKQSLEAQQQNTLLQAWVDNRREEFESQQRLQINSALIADR